MGSLPELTERRPRGASRTVSDPHRHRAVLAQLPVSTIYKREWLWRKPKNGARANLAPAALGAGSGGGGVAGAGAGPGAGAGRRRESGASSLGAASVRRLLARPPARVPAPLVRRYGLVCAAAALGSAALWPFTALAGAEAGAAPLAVMHAVAALVAPFSPFILRKVGTTAAVAVAHLVLCALLVAHAVATPLSVLLPLYGLCGATLSPMALALSASASNLSQAAGDEARRKAALRRALRALRGAQDLGLVLGTLLLGAALAAWPEEVTAPAAGANASARWAPADEYGLDDDYEERVCGAAGCPAGGGGGGGAALSGAGRRALLALWAALALGAAALAAGSAPAPPSPPPDDRAVLRDPRALLGAPMGLFIGLQQGFIYTSYIKWYGVCVGGWWCAWRALAGLSVLRGLAVGTLTMAAARGRGGVRTALGAGGAAAQASLLLALLQWRAARTDLALPALAACAWGGCGALWEVLQARGGGAGGGAGWRGVAAAVEGARHAGLALACAARRVLCVRAQLPVLAAALAVALAAHTTLELRLRRGADTRHRS